MPADPDKALSYTAAQARRAAGITQRQLDYWEQRGLLRPSLAHPGRRGKDRRYSYTDLVKLRVVKELRQAGLSLQRIRKAVRALKQRDPDMDPLLEEKLITDGQRVFVSTAEVGTLKEILRGGQLAFSVILLGKLEARVRRTIRLTRPRGASASA